MRGLVAGLALMLSTPLGAAWQPAWSAPGLGFEDWTQPQARDAREGWERFAVRYPPAPENLAPAALLGSDLLLLWQNTISGKDGSHCPYYPSCSRYSRVAVENYGLALGVIMTADRLSRCHEHPNEAGDYAMRSRQNESMIWDPPTLDAWWSKKSK